MPGTIKDTWNKVDEILNNAKQVCQFVVWSPKIGNEEQKKAVFENESFEEAVKYFLEMRDRSIEIQISYPELKKRGRKSINNASQDSERMANIKHNLTSHIRQELFNDITLSLIPNKTRNATFTQSRSSRVNFLNMSPIFRVSVDPNL